MSGTMARQGGWVQLEQCDMCLAWNIAKMAKGGISCSTMREMHCFIEKPSAGVRNTQKWAVETPGHGDVKVAMERLLAMHRENPMAGCLP